MKYILKACEIHGDDCFTPWLNNFPIDIRKRFYLRLNRLMHGNFGDYKFLSDGVYELRFTFGPGWRIYYAMPAKRKVLLLLGGNKSTQSKDIKKAVLIYKRFLQESNHG